MPDPAMQTPATLDTADLEPAAPAAARPPDVVYQLWFEQLKQINTLAVAATGGALILLQMGFVEATAVSGASVLAMVVAILVAMNGQNALIEEAGRGAQPGGGVRVRREIAGALLAAGAGAFISYGYFG